MNGRIMTTQLFRMLLFIAVFLLFTGPFALAQVVPGDADSNGSINIVDALVVAQHYVGLIPANFNPDAADVNCNNSIDIIDALLIAQYYVGLISEFLDCTITPAPTPVSQLDKYLELIRKWAREQDIDLTGYNIKLIESKATDYILPGYTFFILYLIQYPVAYGNPDKQLGTHCIAAIDADNAIELIPEVNTLEVFYRDHQITISSSEDRVNAIKAWLHLSQEYKNDGYYRFLVSDDDITGEYIIADYIEWRVTGTSRVISGGEGFITAAMMFGVDGMLAYIISEEYELIEGLRPICQSTKLLDKDPVVRKMAEQDLLSMGVSAEDYLAARRAKASPELKQAIDRIWERIIQLEEKRKRIRDSLSK